MEASLGVLCLWGQWKGSGLLWGRQICGAYRVVSLLYWLLPLSGHFGAPYSEPITVTIIPTGPDPSVHSQSSSVIVTAGDLLSVADLSLVSSVDNNRILPETGPIHHE